MDRISWSFLWFLHWLRVTGSWLQKKGGQQISARTPERCPTLLKHKKQATVLQMSFQSMDKLEANSKPVCTETKSNYDPSSHCLVPNLNNERNITDLSWRGCVWPARLRRIYEISNLFLSNKSMIQEQWDSFCIKEDWGTGRTSTLSDTRQYGFYFRPLVLETKACSIWVLKC